MNIDKLFLWSLGVLLCGLTGGIAHAELSSSSDDLPTCWCESCHAMVNCKDLEDSNLTASASSSKQSSPVSGSASSTAPKE